MKSIPLEAQQNPEIYKAIKIAEKQEEYNTLHSVIEHNPEEGTFCYNICFELSDWEILQILKTRRIYYQRLVGNPSSNFNPMNILFENPLPNKEDNLTVYPGATEEIIKQYEDFMARKTTLH